MIRRRTPDGRGQGPDSARRGPTALVRPVTENDDAGMADGTLVEMELDECLRRLASQPVGRVAVVNDGLIVVVPVNHRVLQRGTKTWIVFRTKRDGILDRDNVHAAFEVDDGHAVRRTGWSVLAQGILLHLDPDAAEVRKWFDPQPWIRDDRDRWMALEAFAITGRRITA